MQEGKESRSTSLECREAIRSRIGIHRQRQGSSELIGDSGKKKIDTNPLNDVSINHVQQRLK
jgi:hypothetical protein